MRVEMPAGPEGAGSTVSRVANEAVGPTADFAAGGKRAGWQSCDPGSAWRRPHCARGAVNLRKISELAMMRNLVPAWDKGVRLLHLCPMVDSGAEVDRDGIVEVVADLLGDILDRCSRGDTLVIETGQRGGRSSFVISGSTSGCRAISAGLPGPTLLPARGEDSPDCRGRRMAGIRLAVIQEGAVLDFRQECDGSVVAILSLSD